MARALQVQDVHCLPLLYIMLREESSVENADVAYGSALNDGSLPVRACSEHTMACKLVRRRSDMKQVSTIETSIPMATNLVPSTRHDTDSKRGRHHQQRNEATANDNLKRQIFHMKRGPVAEVSPMVCRQLIERMCSQHKEPGACQL